jgi:hypothetical protein
MLKEYLSFFKRLIVGGIYQVNHHFLILDWHGSHITLKAIMWAQQFGSNIITLLNHTFHALHALHPLDVPCFKPSKTRFKKKRDEYMAKNNYVESNKITIAGWVGKALSQALI